MTKNICLRTTLAATLLFALSPSGCADQPAQNGPVYGGAVVRVYSQLPPSSVYSVTVTITADDMTTIVVPLTKVGDQWTANISEIPAGTNRTFTLAARDASGTMLYSGVATGVTITAGQTASVSISGQEANPPAGSGNASPVIDALVASSIAVTPGATVSLFVTAHDPDAADTLSYLWTSPSGAFPGMDSGASDHADTASTTWTAPATEGTYQITLQVQDNHQAQTTMSVAITVRAESDAGTEGGCEAGTTISVTLNNWPVVTGVTSTQGRIDVGESTKLDVVASDADGDTLTYAWTADTGCAGTFDAANVKSPTFALGNALPTSGKCTFTVTVDDGRGGSNRGTLTISAAVPPTVNLAPVITSATQSVERVAAGGTVTFSVQANDPDGPSVTFAWTATAGSLGTPTDTAGSSQMVWTAPTPFTSEAFIRATVSDASGVTTIRTFEVFMAIGGSTGTSTSTATSTGVDITAPTVSALSFSTSTATSTASSLTVDTSAGPATVTVAFTVADDLSGIAQVSVQLQSQSGSQVQGCSVTTPTDASAPLTLGGSCNITFPQHSEAGVWQVKWMRIADKAGNTAELAAAALAAQGLPTTLTVQSSTVDTAPPTVTALSFTPTSIDTTNSAATVTVSATITDNLSGFNSAGFMFYDPSGGQAQPCWIRRPSGASQLRVFSGTCTVEFPRYSAPGTWTIGQVYLSDEATNEIRLNAADLTAKGLPVNLTVTSAADTTPPTLNAFTFTPSVATGSGNATVTATATVTDNQSGIWEVDVEFTSPSGKQSQECYIYPPGDSTPATLTGTCSVVIPQYSEVGNWTVEWLYYSDAVSNYSLLGPNDLAALGFPSTLTVTAGP